MVYGIKKKHKKRTGQKILIAAYNLAEFDKYAMNRYDYVWIHTVQQINRRYPALIVLTESAKKLREFNSIVKSCVRKGFPVIDLAGPQETT